jgi:hypothetical protein
MANEPDPPESWRVYEGDETPDPEPPAEPPNVPYGDTPIVPYGGAGQSFSSPIVIRTGGSAAPKLILLIVAIVVLAGGAAAAVAIFAAVDTGISGIGGVDPKDPADFADMVDEIEEKTGSTIIQQVGLYDGYAIIYLPYGSDAADDRQIGYRWDGGGLEEWTKTTSTSPRFDLSEINPEVIDGMCDPVLEQADGATAGDCYVFISKPGQGSDAWFSAGASDEFGKYYSVMYDKNGVEIPAP